MKADYKLNDQEIKGLSFTTQRKPNQKWRSWSSRITLYSVEDVQKLSRQKYLGIIHIVLERAHNKSPAQLATRPDPKIKRREMLTAALEAVGLNIDNHQCREFIRNGHGGLASIPSIVQDRLAVLEQRQELTAALPAERLEIWQ